MSNITEFGRLRSGEAVQLITITNAAGTLSAEIITLGAAIKKLCAPDRDGNMADVVMGQDTLEEYAEHAFCTAAFIGRFANRIGGAAFTLNGKTYELTSNNFGSCLHGGTGNYQYRNFTVEDAGDDFVKLSVIEHGEGGFPGTVKATLEYKITDANEIVLSYSGTPTEDTPINFTNHAYFNLAGHDAGYAADTELTINADFYTALNENCLPTGEIFDITGTPLDFRTPRKLGPALDEVKASSFNQGGFDHNYVLKGRGYREVAEAYDPKSGRVMTVLTDQPGMQLYTANGFSGQVAGKDGARYVQHGAFCYETQGFPNSPNLDHFPNPYVKAGETFKTVTAYRFSVR